MTTDRLVPAADPPAGPAPPAGTPHLLSPLARRLVDDHQPLARAIARRFGGRGENVEDLEQVAMVGLVKAAIRFEPERGFAFTTYAVATITGELKRHFRNTRWKVHVPRAVQERYLLVRETIDDIVTRLGRAPTVAEVVVATGLPEEQVLEAYEAGTTFRVESIDGSGGGDTWAGLACTDSRMERVVDAVALRTLVGALPAREREVIDLRFVQQLSQAEIAARIGLSQMQVSRILARVLAELRRKLAR